MNNEIKAYLTDILDAINGIHEHLGAIRDFNIYRDNRTIRKAIERELEIIGELQYQITI